MGTKAFALSAIVAVSLAVTGSHPANAQSYPERLIKIVVPFPAGGPSDVAARLVTQPLSSKLGQSVIIENLPGAGGRTGAKAVAQQAPMATRCCWAAPTPTPSRSRSIAI